MSATRSGALSECVLVRGAVGLRNPDTFDATPSGNLNYLEAASATAGPPDAGDRRPSPYAVLESGVRFCLPDSGPVKQRWRATRAALMARAEHGTATSE